MSEKNQDGRLDDQMHDAPAWRPSRPGTRWMVYCLVCAVLYFAAWDSTKRFGSVDIQTKEYGLYHKRMNSPCPLVIVVEDIDGPVTYLWIFGAIIRVSDDNAITLT